jgi:hypothetical protein
MNITIAEAPDHLPLFTLSRDGEPTGTVFDLLKRRLGGTKRLRVVLNPDTLRHVKVRDHDADVTDPAQRAQAIAAFRAKYVDDPACPGHPDDSRLRGD